MDIHFGLLSLPTNERSYPQSNRGFTLSLIESIINWLLGIIQFVIAILLGSILTGLFTVYIVIPKIMRNKDIQELLTLFREGKAYLKEILENQKKKGGENLAEEKPEEEKEPEKEEGEGEG